MKASELITLLQDAIDKYGDLDIKTLDCEYGAEEISQVKPTPHFYAVEGEEDFLLIQ